MQKFIELRNKVEFPNTLNIHELFKFYNTIVKTEATLDEETQKFVNMDMQMFLLERKELHTSLEEGNRFRTDETLGEDRNDFYELMVGESNLDVIKYLYLDYLIEFGDKEKKYLYAKQLSEVIFSIEASYQGDEYELISPLSRLVDVAIRLKLEKETQKTIAILVCRIETLIKRFDYRWILELAQLVRAIGYQKNDMRLTEQQRNIILSAMEESKDYYTKQNHLGVTEGFLIELIQWCKEGGKKKKINGYQTEIAKAYISKSIEQDGRQEKSYYVEAHFLEQAARVYLNIGNTEDAHKLQVKIKQAYRNYREKEMRKIPFDFDLPQDTFESYYSQFKESTVEESFKKLSLIGYQTPNVKKALDTAKKNVDKADYILWGTQTKLADDRKIFEANNREEKILNEMSDVYHNALMTHFGIYYDYTFERLRKEGLSLETLSDRICDWMYFDNDARVLVEIGLEHYWNEDYISSLSILVPQFENCLRQFFHAGGFNTTVMRKGNAQQEITFNSFLEKDYVEENIEDDLLFMIKFVMVEETGYNLRNNIAHGLAKLRDFRKDYAHTVVYLFMQLTRYNW